MYGPTWPVLLMYGSHDMRYTGFCKLTVVNGTPGNGASHYILLLSLLLLQLNIYFGSINPFCSYFDTLSLLGLFCFAWDIPTIFAYRVRIYHM